MLASLIEANKASHEIHRRHLQGERKKSVDGVFSSLSLEAFGRNKNVSFANIFKTMLPSKAFVLCKSPRALAQSADFSPIETKAMLTMFLPSKPETSSVPPSMS